MELTTRSRDCKAMVVASVTATCGGVALATIGPGNGVTAYVGMALSTMVS